MRAIYLIGFWTAIALGWYFYGYQMAILVCLVLILSGVNSSVVAQDLRDDIDSDNYF